MGMGFTAGMCIGRFSDIRSVVMFERKDVESAVPNPLFTLIC